MKIEIHLKDLISWVLIIGLYLFVVITHIQYRAEMKTNNFINSAAAQINANTNFRLTATGNPATKLPPRSKEREE